MDFVSKTKLSKTVYRKGLSKVYVQANAQPPIAKWLWNTSHIENKKEAFVKRSTPNLHTVLWPTT